MTFTHHYELVLHEQQVYVRALNQEHGDTQWTLLQDFKTHIGTMDDVMDVLAGGDIKAITADEGNLAIVTNSGRAYYAKLDKHSDSIEWIRDWGLLKRIKGKRSILHLDERYIMLCMSHAPPYKSRLDGLNKNQDNLFGITTFYVFDTQTGYIICSDPWWRSVPSHKIRPPKGIAPRSMSASGSMLAIINEKNEIYTMLVDFDSGQNPLMRYGYSHQAFMNLRDNETSAVFQGSDSDIEQAKKKITPDLLKAVFRQRNLPMGVWIKHHVPQEAISFGHITILQVGPNNRDDFELRCWGSKLCDDVPVSGYFSKPINASQWTFHAANESELSPYLISDASTSTKALSKTMSMKLSTFGLHSSPSVELSCRYFNPYRDYNHLKVTINAIVYTLYLFLDTQVSHKSTTWCKATLMLGKKLLNAGDQQAQAFKQCFFGNNTVQTMLFKRDKESWEGTAFRLRPTRPLHNISMTIEESEASAINTNMV